MLKLLKLPDKYLKYIVATLLVIIPLYPKFPFMRIPGTYVSIRIEDFLLLFVAVLVIIKVAPKIKEMFKDEVIRSILLFLLIGLSSLVSGIFLTQTVEIPIGILHYLRRIEYFIPLFYVLVSSPKSFKRNLDFYMKTIMIVIFLVFLYGFGQRYFHFPVIITQNEEYSKGAALFSVPGGHINSTFAGHYDLATYLVLVLPIITSLFFFLKSKLSKLLVGVVWLSGFWLLVNSLSRISLVSFIVASSVSLFLLKKYKAILIVVIVSVLLSATSPNLYARYKRIYDVLYLKIASKLVVKAQDTEVTLPSEGMDLKGEVTPTPMPVFEDRSSNIRLVVEWPRATRSFVKNPFLGTGYSSIGLAVDNDYLRLLAEVGLLGFLGFFLIFAKIAKEFLPLFPIKEKVDLRIIYICGIIGGIIGVFVNAVFIDVFEASKLAIAFWLLVGMAISLNRKKLNDQKN